MKTFEFYGVQTPTRYFQRNLVTVAPFHTLEAAEASLRDAHSSGRIVRVIGRFEDDAVFEVTENSDQTEGKGVTVRVGLFSDLVVALRVAKGRGGMGYGYGGVSLVAERSIFDTFEQFQAAGRERAVRGVAKVSLLEYGGMNSDYFSITEDAAETQRQAADPEYAEFLRLKQRFER